MANRPFASARDGKREGTHELFPGLAHMSQGVVLVGSIFSGLLLLGISLMVHRNRRANAEKKRKQEFAVCWLAVLAELALALDRMRDTTHHLIRDHQRPPRLESVHKSDILLHQWLQEGYLLLANDHEDTGIVESLHKDLLLFSWNVNQATNTRLRRLAAVRAFRTDSDKLGKLLEVYDNAAIRLSCNRHYGMVDAWKRSVESQTAFCVEHGLEGGEHLVAPSAIPSDWQMDESEPWTIKGLAPVGDHAWEP